MFGFGKKTVETSLHTSGMSCNHCEMRVMNALKAIKGVKDVQARAATGIVTIRHEDGVSLDALKDAVTEAGYTVTN
ncbi:heavy-metal-associated domain-containing protein [Parasphaerochaeta coccoides]|nr:heavy-metal-associated domain-containing protein [Parasphaerochaeta coccoides]